MPTDFHGTFDPKRDLDEIIFVCDDCGREISYGNSCTACSLYPDKICKDCMCDLENHVLREIGRADIAEDNEAAKASLDYVSNILGDKEIDNRKTPRNFSGKNIEYEKKSWEKHFKNIKQRNKNDRK